MQAATDSGKHQSSPAAGILSLLSWRHFFVRDLVCVKRARNALEGPKQLVRHVVQQSVPYKLALKVRAFNECLLYSQGEQKIIIVIVLGVIFAECGCITRVNETSKFGKESSDNAAISVLFVFWPRNYENLVAKNLRELGMFSRSIGPISALSHGFAKYGQESGFFADGSESGKGATLFIFPIGSDRWEIYCPTHPILTTSDLFPRLVIGILIILMCCMSKAAYFAPELAAAVRGVVLVGH
ncbi:hypothetical protein GEV33_010853 [Tenebrio molitor]|uniref:Uncharacterized protein n=1 Tax=Tenebrio molitor TaxID=7067 RepID=A0A8J6HDY3_TENMO|nr:hypothetical protein GEV33_010853 [Tenebrio molitor]